MAWRSLARPAAVRETLTRDPDAPDTAVVHNTDVMRGRRPLAGAPRMPMPGKDMSMNPQSNAFERDAAIRARSRMERRGKRRLAKDIVARRLRQRRGLTGAVLSGGAAAALATVATLFEFAL